MAIDPGSAEDAEKSMRRRYRRTVAGIAFAVLIVACVLVVWMSNALDPLRAG